VQVPYVERMDLAYAAADMVLCRSGAMTVAEVSAVGLPAVYVPLPHGNGEQTDNAAPAVEAGAALMLPDAELSAERLVERVIPLLRDPQQLDNMSAAAGGLGHATADEELARLALQAAKSDRPRTGGRAHMIGETRVTLDAAGGTAAATADEELARLALQAAKSDRPRT